MTSCPDKPTASVIGWLCLELALLGQACSGPAPAPDRSVLQSGVNEVPTVGLFVEGPRLHLILANYRQSVTKSAVREHLWTAPLRTLSAPFYEVVEEEYRTVVREAGLFKRLLHNAGPE